MIKIVEAYSGKIMPEIEMEQISWQTTTDDSNGIITSAYLPTKLAPFKLKTSPYNSVAEMNSAILKAKMDTINAKKDIVLLIIRHGEKNVSITQRELSGHEAKLHSLTVNRIPFYTYNKTITIDKELLNKMSVVYNLILKIDKKDFDVLSLTLNSIIDSYKNTGVVSKKDLKWMNEIYSKYKRLGDLYD